MSEEHKEAGDFLLPFSESLPSLSVEISHLKEAEARLPEIRTVSPATYAELESVFGKAYREQKAQVRKIEMHILKVKAEIIRLSGVCIFDKYPTFLEQRPKIKDSTDTRARFIENDPDVVMYKERLGNLEIISKICGDKVQEMENAYKVLRRQIDLVVKSGVPFKLY